MAAATPTKIITGEVQNFASTDTVPLTNGGSAASTAAGARVTFLDRCCVTFNGASFSPADATTYYFGNFIAPATTANRHYRPIPIARVLREAVLTMRVQTVTGTTEQSTVSISINNGSTLITISAVVQCDQNIQTYTVTGLTQAIAANDTIEMKWLTPTWATNPTGVVPTVDLYLE